MALVGDLRNINLGDIFQTLAMNRQVGTLIVRDGITERRVFFSKEGVSLCSPLAGRQPRLGTFLVGEQILTGEQLLAALSHQKETGLLLGEQLVSLGYCSTEQITEAVRFQAAAQLYELFILDQGEFEFIERPAPSSADAASPYAGVAFDPSAIVMEAARRIDELDLIRQTIPDENEFYIATGGSLPSLEPGEWTGRHTALLDLVDGTRTLADVKQDFHLGPFDTATLLFELLEWRQIRPATGDELLKEAWFFFDQRRPDLATQYLDRAHLREPGNTRVLELLAHCFEALEERRSAAGALLKLGNILKLSGQMGEAVNALEKSVKYDPGCADAAVLLMRIYRDLGDLDAAALKAAHAAEILCEQELYERCIEVCRETLDESPDILPLHVQLVNALLGMGLREKAVDELEQVALQLEKKRSPRQLEEVYKKILLLDPSRREYLKRLQKLQSGSRDRRRKQTKIAAIAGAVGIAVCLGLTVFTGSPSPEEMLGQAWNHFNSGSFQEAESLAREVIAQAPDSDQAIEAQNLIVSVQRKREGGGSRAREAWRGIHQTVVRRFKPATESFDGAQFVRGFDHLALAVEYLEGPDYAEAFAMLDPKDADRIQDVAGQFVGNLLKKYAEHLENLGSECRGNLNNLPEIALQRATVEELQTYAEAAEKVLRAADAAERSKNLGRVKKILAIIPRGSTPLGERITKAAQTLDEIWEAAEQRYHGSRSLLLRQEILLDLTATLKDVRDSCFRGALRQARDQCREFLARCARFSVETPAKYYAPVAREIFDDDGKDVDGRISLELEKVERILTAISHGDDLVRTGRYADANDHFRALINDNFRVDFSNHVRLVLRLRTSPAGAEVRSRCGSEPEVRVGLTSRDGLLLRYHPYDPTTITVTKGSFETLEFTVPGYAAEHPATVDLPLQKLIAWRSASGPVQGSPAPWRRSLLVASRDGKLRAFATENGRGTHEHDLGILSGLAFTPVVAGDLVYVSSPSEDLLAVDLQRSETLWSFTADATLGTGPVLAGGTVSFADEDGRLYGVREGKEIWRVAAEGRIRAGLAVARDSLLAATIEGRVYCVDPRTGLTNWSRDVGSPVYVTPAVCGDRVVIVATESSNLIALSLDTGDVLWKTTIGEPIADRLEVHGDVLCLATLAGSIFILDAPSGEVSDTRKFAGAVSFKTGPVWHAGILYLASTTGSLYAISDEEGLQWVFDLEQPVSGPPVVSDGRLFVVTEPGSVFSFLISGK